MSDTPQTAFRNWLLLCCFMVLAMAVVGAVTRLTESGLSITEWKPVTGALPPLTEEHWQQEFALYQKTPEFSQKHFWMNLEDFKKIYVWEWTHRLLGRLIGVVFAMPLLWFWARRQIPSGYGWKLVGLMVLGGAQGFVGWYMVKSGLVDRPSVSHFRLAAHLGLAVLIFSLMWWIALDFFNHPIAAPVPKSLTQHGWGMLGLLALTMVWGAFTAGLDGGMIYNTFPRMNEHWIPPELTFNAPVWINGLHAPAAVQFIHRCLALLTAAGILALGWRARDTALAAMVFVQTGLGIATILSQVAIPLAALHQAGAIILLALLLRRLHILSHS
ncbi:MAG: COX15/CtaA family protein [Micavibrio aeruginosavorus]|uniref:COX15/CtaA family protein n=1 Tax=Micavibrio aeruginosavorus TaxID=349221 RepID=A0A7T5R346_9BACT|nr:MAG: COX15/CtaA family protein [Micavibrio aeruginosavorus]